MLANVVNHYICPFGPSMSNILWQYYENGVLKLRCPNSYFEVYEFILYLSLKSHTIFSDLKITIALALSESK